MNKTTRLLLLACVQMGFNIAYTQDYTIINSPDKKIVAEVVLNKAGQAAYSLSTAGQTVLRSSRLGLISAKDDFSKNLRFVNASSTELVKDSYELFTGKKKTVSYTANKKTIHLVNSSGKKIDIIFQVSNDGVAFRYYFPEVPNNGIIITDELTSYNFDSTAKAFLQPMSTSKSGWEQTNPAYEEHYKQSVQAGTPAPTKAGWVYPALFSYKNNWVLITEAYTDTSWCATRLRQESPGGEYFVGFPDAREIIPDAGLLPQATTPFYSPWRIVVAGSLKTIAESTLGTDVAKPAAKADLSYIKPGKASWSWINSKDDFIVYDEQKKYIDFAADMHWQYCLIDVNWDKKIGYDKIKELSAYAAAKNVGLLLWYNSAGSWNTVKYTPKNMLLTHESRIKEFSRLVDMGIKGVKIDFFAGDGRSVVAYYYDILRDAAQYKLLVNFHGATLPRGLARTYPNLVSTEGVRGFEMITFNQADADLEATHCAMLPFTRNAFDPMDFTPTNLYKIPTRVQRKTTGAFELALSVLFLSGIQHFAESPDGMSHVPADVKQFLRDLPGSWDDIRFIDGYPGKFVVIARKSGSKWYVAGINAGDNSKGIQLDLKQFNKKKITCITDGEAPLTFATKVLQQNDKEITMKPNGGFMLVME